MYLLTDSAVVHGFWTGQLSLHTKTLRMIVADLLTLLPFPRPGVRWQHIPRELNKVADWLAGEASRAALRVG